jgi:hypothetical protein
MPILLMSLCALISLLFRSHFENGLGYSSCYKNFFHTGGWNSYWVIVSSLIFSGVVIRRKHHPSEWTLFSLIVSIEFSSIILKLFDGGGVCRIGWGDSLNRCLLHITGFLSLYLLEISNIYDATRFFKKSKKRVKGGPERGKRK